VENRDYDPCEWFSKSCLVVDSIKSPKLRESPDEPRLDQNRRRRPWATVVNSSLVALIDEVEHRLEICKLEIPTSGPYLQTLCFLDLPPLASVASLFVVAISKEWVPTSKHHAQSRSSRGCHLPFFSPTIGTIALHYEEETAVGRRFYAMIISVPALLSAISTGVRSVPWVEWPGALLARTCSEWDLGLHQLALSGSPAPGGTPL